MSYLKRKVEGKMRKKRKTSKNLKKEYLHLRERYSVPKQTY